tara:strand:- start:3 stop:1043 length:1041 start_codon:yes stop_codon:yes gene_type:complete
VDASINIVVVGLGGMGQRNCAHVYDSPSFTLYGVQDVNQSVSASVADKYKVRSYSDFDALLSDEAVDAVFVCTPHFLLAAYGMRVLGSGKHLILEKPMAIDVEDANALLAESERAGRHIAINYARVHTPVIRRARELLDSGVVGEAETIDIRWSSHKSAGYYQGAHSPTPDDWRANKEKSGGGMLIMTTCHAIHYAQYLVGMRPLTAAANALNTGGIGDVEDVLQGVISYENGVIGSVSTSSSQRGSSTNDMVIAGSQGTLVIEGDSLRFFSTRVIDGQRPGKWHAEKHEASERYLDDWLDEVANSISTGAKPIAEPSLARDTLALIQALYDSSQTGRTIQIGSIV